MRVLLTRPRDDAERTAGILRAQGHDVVISPVVEVVPTGEPLPEGSLAAVLATSAQAFAALGTLPSRLADLPVLVVGDRTAAAARDAGARTVRSAAGDAAALAALVPTVAAAPGPLLYLAGHDRKPDLENLLRKAGFHVEVAVVYEARAADRLSRPAALALAAGTVDAVLHYSRRSASLFIGLAGTAGCHARAIAARHLCLSEDAAAPLRQAGAADVMVADQPNQKALLLLLERL